MAMAVMRVDIFVPRALTGLYANFSTSTPTTAQTITAATTASQAGMPMEINRGTVNTRV